MVSKAFEINGLGYLNTRIKDQSTLSLVGRKAVSCLGVEGIVFDGEDARLLLGWYVRLLLKVLTLCNVVVDNSLFVRMLV